MDVGCILSRKLVMNSVHLQSVRAKGVEVRLENVVGLIAWRPQGFKHSELREIIVI